MTPTDRIDEWSRTGWVTHGAPEGEPADVLRARLRKGSIPAILDSNARRHPNKLAIKVDDDALTYAALVYRIARTAGWLHTRGIRRGDRVIVSGRNSVDLVVACLAVKWAEGICVVANPTYTAPELQHYVTDSGARGLLADADVVLKLQDFAGWDDRVAVASLGGDSHGENLPAIDDVIATAPVLPVPRLPNSLVCALQYTSGTTGRAKGVQLSHGNLLAYFRAILLAWGWRPTDTLVHSLPLTHGHGLNGVFTALVAGASAVVLPRTDPERLCRVMQDERASVLYAVPAIWERLLGFEHFSSDSFASLRLYTSGSAPLSPEMSERIRVALGRERPLERYGATETGVALSNPLNGRRIEGTVGTPAPGAEVRICDDGGQPVSPGSDGEIVVRGPGVSTGYWGISDNSPYVLPDGWFRTGDVGRVDPATGYVSITGRLKEMIITGGLNVYPREVELAAASYSGVKDAAVFAAPSERWGEEVVMGVVAEADGVNTDGLLRHLRTQLAAYKVPKQIMLLDSIPRNQMGKVQRGELTALVAGQRSVSNDSS